MTKDRQLGFIGGGNMATALIKGLAESGVYEKGRMMASDKEEKRRLDIFKRFGVETTASNVEVVQRCEAVTLAVKPQNMKEVLEEIRPVVREDQLIISIAAGVPLRVVGDGLGRTVPLIRVMPNTPALVLQGISALAAGGSAGPSHLGIARRIFNAVGETVEVEESLMDAVTAVSGSGPGYVFRLMECMVEAGLAVGLERETCRRLVVQTFLGAAHLAKNSEESLARLREMVTSPGGTTAAGLGVFNEMGLDAMVRKAVQAARDRGVELGKGR
jgi:pyrroline-5-carboxylate reductase